MWIIFYGRKLGMDKREIMATGYGEMLDMITCLSITEGTAKEKRKSKVSGFEEVMALR